MCVRHVDPPSCQPHVQVILIMVAGASLAGAYLIMVAGAGLALAALVAGAALAGAGPTAGVGAAGAGGGLDGVIPAVAGRVVVGGAECLAAMSPGEWQKPVLKLQ